MSTSHLSLLKGPYCQRDTKYIFSSLALNCPPVSALLTVTDRPIFVHHYNLMPISSQTRINPYARVSTPLHTVINDIGSSKKDARQTALVDSNSRLSENDLRRPMASDQMRNPSKALSYASSFRELVIMSNIVTSQ